MGEFLASFLAETIGLFIFRIIYCIVGFPVIFIGNIFRGDADKLTYTFENLFQASSDLTVFILAGFFIALFGFGIIFGLISLAEILISKIVILL